MKMPSSINTSNLLSFLVAHIHYLQLLKFPTLPYMVFTTQTILCKYNVIIIIVIINYTTMTLSLTGILIRAVIKGTGLPFLITNMLISSVLLTSSRHSTLVSKLYSREGTSRGSCMWCMWCVCMCACLCVQINVYDFTMLLKGKYKVTHSINFMVVGIEVYNIVVIHPGYCNNHYLLIRTSYIRLLVVIITTFLMNSITK